MSFSHRIVGVLSFFNSKLRISVWMSWVTVNIDVGLLTLEVESVVLSLLCYTVKEEKETGCLQNWCTDVFFLLLW